MMMRLTNQIGKSIWIAAHQVVWMYVDETVNGNFTVIQTLLRGDMGILVVRETPDEILAKPVWQKLLASPRR